MRPSHPSRLPRGVRLFGAGFNTAIAIVFALQPDAFGVVVCVVSALILLTGDGA